MKSLFYKSNFLITIFIVVTIMFTLTASAIMEQFIKFDKHLTFLSEDYIFSKIYTSSGMDNSITISKILEACKEIKNPLFISREYPFTQGKSVFYNNKDMFPINMISGRMFDESDFNHNSNTAIISKEIRDECISRDNELLFEHEKHLYRVIGTFVDKKDNSNSTLYYINMAASNSINDDLVGTFIFDSKQFSCTDFEKISSDLHNLDNDILIEYREAKNKKNDITNVVSNSKMMILILISTNILVLLNSYTAVKNWIDGKKREIGVRKLVGSTNRQLYISIFKQYMILVSISFVIGIIISFIIFKFCDNKLYGEELNIVGIIMSFIITNIVGIITIVGTLFILNRKQIIEEIR